MQGDLQEKNCPNVFIFVLKLVERNAVKMSKRFCAEKSRGRIFGTDEQLIRPKVYGCARIN